MQSVMNEAEVFLDLCMAGVVPVNQVRAGKLAKEEPIIGLEREFFEGLTIFDPEFDGSSLGFRQYLFQLLGHAVDEGFLPSIEFLTYFGAELFVFGAFLFTSSGHFEQFARVIL